MLSREEHLKRSKEEARLYLRDGDVPGAIASILSDLDKHPETKTGNTLKRLGMYVAMTRDLKEAERFIDGFN